MSPVKHHNPSIELLKFVAVLLIVNCHFKEQYVSFREFATGGGIGDALFFFCSGYTLFLGRFGRFDEWYKRRIRRIYPSVLAFGLMSWLVWSYDMRLGDLLTVGAGWFVSCIMIYYVIFYAIRRWASDRLWVPYVASAVLIAVWYSQFFNPMRDSLRAQGEPWRSLLFTTVPANGIWVYHWNYLKWLLFFPAFLMGAHVGKREAAGIGRKIESWPMALVRVVACVAVFYGIQLFCSHNPEWSWLQIFSLLPLLAICYATFLLCRTSLAMKIVENRTWGRAVTFIGGLCLEIYLVQPCVRTTALNHLFPLNLFILFVLMVIAAYACRVIGRFLQQTFSSEDGYDWGKIFKL